MKLSCPAPAKLNLFLHVTGRKPNGYHLLQTLFTFVDLQDTLHFELRQDGVIQRINSIAGVDMQQDLCVRAAKLLQEYANCPLGVDILLEKNIPMGGGLGGGSSDAATTLIALNKLWDLKLPRKVLMELGLKLGADVPVFVFGQNAFAEGVGEELQAFPVVPAWYVILFPPVHVPTAEIFSHPLLTRNTDSMTMRALLNETVQVLRNDLQSVACSLYPVVAEYLEYLGRFGEAKMTGSGACVFASFASKQEADVVLEQLPESMKGVVVQGLSEHPLKGWLPN